MTRTDLLALAERVEQGDYGSPLIKALYDAFGGGSAPLHALDSRDAIEAAERAAVSEEPVAFLIKFTSDTGMESMGSIFFEREEAEKEVASSYFSDDGYVVPLYTRPLPSPPEAPKGEE